MTAVRRSSAAFFVLSFLGAGPGCFEPSSFPKDGGAGSGLGGVSGNAGGGGVGGMPGRGGAGGAAGGDGPGGAGTAGAAGGGMSAGSGGAAMMGGRSGAGGGTGGAMGLGGSGAGGRGGGIGGIGGSTPAGAGGRSGSGGAGGGGTGTAGHAGTAGAGSGGSAGKGGSAGTPCELGRPLNATPVAVFDATPAGSCGLTCNASAALVTDGVATGLDCDDRPSSSVKIDVAVATGCVAADFGAVVNLDPVIIRARGVADACGRACSDGMCNTFVAMEVFYGTSRGAYKWARQIELTRSFEDYPVIFNVAARYVVVCRNGGGSFRDDVAVDSIRTGNACGGP